MKLALHSEDKLCLVVVMFLSVFGIRVINDGLTK